MITVAGDISGQQNMFKTSWTGMKILSGFFSRGKNMKLQIIYMYM